MRKILFINENALGHSSYLPVFAREIEQHPEYGFEVEMLSVAPLPEEYEREANQDFRGAARLGLSQHYRRWREAASRYAAKLTREALVRDRYAAVVVNTQSVALDLPSVLSPDLPLFVCLDATFEQLRQSPWFAANHLSRLLQPWTIGDLLEKERRLYARTQKLLPWSEPVAQSLREQYSIDPSRIEILPPSLPLSSPVFAENDSAASEGLPQILFLGGDFRRKGGPLLLECFRRHFRGNAELQIITQSEVRPEEGVKVWKNIKAYSPEWLERWQKASVFVFPSLLETFGIVLLEAQAFSVPIVSSRAGAATTLLADGKAGWLIDPQNEAALKAAISEAVGKPDLAKEKVLYGKERLGRENDQSRNTIRLLGWVG